jgi:hypothetical protein
MSDNERVRWATALTTAGWLFVVAYLAFVTAMFRRASALKSGSFDDGVWGQRIEIMSFVSIHQNVIMLAPAAAACVGATMLASDVADRTHIWLAQLVRVVAGLCYVVIAVAVIGIIALFFRSPDSVSDLGALLGRLGGILMAIAMIRVCLEAERSAVRSG